MINNRQAGRRRGRNNPRQNGGGNRGNGGDSGNRIDNRARGNAAQLLEKYRNMARDAQLAGDRVNMEYYLQFADHYFRVLADNRARQEENQQQRVRRFDENDQDDDFSDDGDGFFPNDMTRSFEPRQPENRQSDNRQYDDGRRDEGQGRREEGRRDDNRRDRDDNRREGRDDFRRDRGERGERNERPDRAERAERAPRDGQREDAPRDNRRPPRERQPAPQPVEAVEDRAAPPVAAPANDVVNETPVEEAPRPRATRGRKPRQPVEAAPELGLDASALPPAIGRPAEVSSDGEEQPAAPVRRTRRPRSTPAQAAE